MPEAAAGKSGQSGAVGFDVWKGSAGLGDQGWCRIRVKLAVATNDLRRMPVCRPDEGLDGEFIRVSVLTGVECIELLPVLWTPR